MRPRPGLRVLVTGGTSGIGRAVTEVLEAFDARVHVCGTDRDRLAGFLTARPGRTGTACDVSSAEQVGHLVAEAEAALGGLDVLVNNAGIAGPTARLEDVDPVEWTRTLEIDLTGAFLCAQRTAPLLKASRGAVVNISSVAGRLGYALRSPYNAAKFGLRGLTESMARELGPDGVRVNEVLPGFVDSDRLNRTTAARAEAMGRPFAEVEQGLLAKTSLRTKVSEQEVALLVAYLLSPAAATISGQSLSICGNVEYL
ncbi:NAD(P)-dependent dehydrogenase (short-subunit alcohol dehydrogenase family) [Lapillicoccus jejuensis]|uniref:NAD(P)-dependent dehydrogenase (Short-subunit alcohol dehydrogenase family) n=1 Tax=Lapillicoccus jejuensis TaxID=402171 RepID=A0A542DY06_9MICO|nr:NAD(P)-dependent dehydrogenase (short-subunit alcohol dehydrogenase family) [Lapillicoccus jejuensis]